MEMIITILMSCAFNVTDAPAAIAAGQPVTATCSGSYTDKADGQPLGTWRMALELQREASAPDGLRATRRSYALDVDRNKPVNLQRLPDDTQAFVVREIRESADRHRPALPGKPPRPVVGI